MKRILLICGLLLSVVTFANAQQGNGRQKMSPEDRARRTTEQLTEKLKLNDDQKTKVMAIYLEQGKTMQKVRGEAGDDRAAMREKMMKLMKETDEKVTALLTDDQKKAYTTWKEERQKQMQSRMGGQGGGGGN